jgi:hypothetical protein
MVSKEKVMKISTLLAASIIAAVVVASPMVSSARNHGTQVTHFRSTSDWASGCIYTGTVITCFYANAYDDNNGVPQGYVDVYQYDYNTSTYKDIHCFGTAYANVASVNQGNGNSSINATLDPASSDCYPYNVSSPLTVNLSGQYNGNYASHNNGNGNSTYLGTSYKYNFQSDYFSETFTGTNGFATGTFDGSASTEHRTQLQKQ